MAILIPANKNQMQDKDFIKKLKLVDILPDPEFKKNHRDILLAQINSGEEIEPVQPGFFRQAFEIFTVLAPNSFAALSSRPALSLAIALLAVAGGGSLGIMAAKDTKPGDRLYAAKIVSEKTQLAITFSEKEKAKLGIEFAGNRAKELSQILSNQPEGGSETQIKELTQNVMKELSAATEYLAKASDEARGKNAHKEVPKKTESSPAGQPLSGSASAKPASGNIPEDGKIFSANAGKDQEGIQISGSAGLAAPVGAPSGAQVAATGDNPEKSVATGTKDQESDGMKVEEMSNMLMEAKKLIDADDIAGSVEKLEAAKTIINGLGSGQESAAGDHATSSDETK